MSVGFQISFFPMYFWFSSNLCDLQALTYNHSAISYFFFTVHKVQKIRQVLIIHSKFSYGGKNLDRFMLCQKSGLYLEIKFLLLNQRAVTVM